MKFYLHNVHTILPRVKNISSLSLSLSLYIYIYIYIERERERERCTHTHYKRIKDQLLPLVEEKLEKTRRKYY